jgi:anti-sigma28 factor (negative regulator of flagellin synthesis)
LEISDSSASRMRRINDPASPTRRQADALPETPPVAADSIEVSAEGRSLLGADELGRARRLAELRSRIDAGTYTVDPAELARRMAERGEA